MRAAVMIMCLLCLGFTGCNAEFTPAQQEAERRKAQEQFLSFATTTKKAGIGYDTGDPYGVMRTWAKCFRKGDLASGYTSILATGEKRLVEDDLVEYEWVLWVPYDPRVPDARLLFLEVYVKGNPPCIKDLRTNKSMD